MGFLLALLWRVSRVPVRIRRMKPTTLHCRYEAHWWELWRPDCVGLQLCRARRAYDGQERANASSAGAPSIGRRDWTAACASAVILIFFAPDDWHYDAF